MSRRLAAFCRTAVVAAIALCPVAAHAQTPPTKVSVGIGGQSLITYLPFALAEHLGYFNAAGLAIQINDFQGGSKSIEALVGGSVDVAVAAFEHALVLQSKGIELKAIALFNLSYGVVLALKPALAKTYRSPADLKGLKFGVTAPGSAAALALAILLAKADLPPSAAAVIGIGTGSGAVAAVKSGALDGVAQFDPVITQLIHDGDMVPIVDTRTPEGMTYLYGGYIASSGVLTTPNFIAQHRAAAQAFAGAIGRAVKWLHDATPEQVAAAVPEAYYGGRRDLYMEAVAKAHTTWTVDGRIPPDAANNTYKVLSTFGPLVGVKDINVSAGFDNTLLGGR